MDLNLPRPPVFSNRTYEVIWGDAGERRSFEDRWSGGIMQYIDWLNERVRELHRILKPTGSLFLHCDWQADAYIKTFILDKIFGDENFRNQIIWKRSDAKGDTSQGAKHLGQVTDTIWCHTKSNETRMNPLFTPLSDEYIKSFYRHINLVNGRDTNLIICLDPVAQLREIPTMK